MKEETEHSAAPAARKGSRCSRCTAVFCSTFGAILLLLSYVVCGAFVFSSLETSHGPAQVKANEVVVSLGVQEQQHQLRAVRQQTVEKLWEITEKLNILYKDNWTALADREMSKFQAELLQNVHQDQLKDLNKKQQIEDSKPRKNERTFAASFLYSLTLITTVGNGQNVPESSVGKIVAMVVISLGLPLLLAYLAMTGAGLAKVVRQCYKLVVCQKVAKSGPQNIQLQPPQKVHDIVHHRNNDCQMSIESCGQVAHLDHCTAVPMWLCLLLLFCYISAGASVFCVYHHGEWSFVDSFFFAFNALWTIGVVDVTTNRSSDMGNDGLFVVICSVYLLVGLSIVAMCFAVVQDSTTTGGRLSACFLGVDHRCGRHLTTGKNGHSSWVYNEGPS